MEIVHNRAQLIKTLGYSNDGVQILCEDDDETNGRLLSWDMFLRTPSSLQKEYIKIYINGIFWRLYDNIGNDEYKLVKSL